MVFGKWILYLHARGRPGIGPIAGGQARGQTAVLNILTFYRFTLNIIQLSTLYKHNPVEHFIYFKHNPVEHPLPLPALARRLLQDWIPPSNSFLYMPSYWHLLPARPAVQMISVPPGPVPDLVSAMVPGLIPGRVLRSVRRTRSRTRNVLHLQLQRRHRACELLHLRLQLHQLRRELRHLRRELLRRWIRSMLRRPLRCSAAAGCAGRAGGRACC